MAPRKSKASGSASNNATRLVGRTLAIMAPLTTKSKKRGASAPSKPPAAKRQRKAVPSFRRNSAPKDALDVYVFGTGVRGELGLGQHRIRMQKPDKAKRPWLNHNLPSRTTRVVQFALGDRHSVALTQDNRILSWGYNEGGALGRGDPLMPAARATDVDSDDDGDDDGDDDDDDEEDDEEDDQDDEEDDDGENVLPSIEDMRAEDCVPDEVRMSFSDGTPNWVQVVACGTASFALTEDGFVYGWGTFKTGGDLSGERRSVIGTLTQPNQRSSWNFFGFNVETDYQSRPVLIPELEKITQLAGGSRHALALDDDGRIWSWGDGHHGQLTRGQTWTRNHERVCLLPARIPKLPKSTAKVVEIACGWYHSLALDADGKVYGWGCNEYGQVGTKRDTPANITIIQPRLLDSLGEFNISKIAAGEHHSLACTHDGRLIVWGKVDQEQLPLSQAGYGAPCPLHRFRFAGQDNPPHIENVFAGKNHCLAISSDKKIFTWGNGDNYATGHYRAGPGTLPSSTPPYLDNPLQLTERRLSKKTWRLADGGDTFSVIACEAVDNGDADSALSDVDSELAKELDGEIDDKTGKFKSPEPDSTPDNGDVDQADDTRMTRETAPSPEDRAQSSGDGAAADGQHSDEADDDGSPLTPQSRSNTSSSGGSDIESGITFASSSPPQRSFTSINAAAPGQFILAPAPTAASRRAERARVRAASVARGPSGRGNGRRSAGIMSTQSGTAVAGPSSQRSGATTRRPLPTGRSSSSRQSGAAARQPLPTARNTASRQGEASTQRPLPTVASGSSSRNNPSASTQPPSAATEGEASTSRGPAAQQQSTSRPQTPPTIRADSSSFLHSNLEAFSPLPDYESDDGGPSVANLSAQQLETSTPSRRRTPPVIEAHRRLNRVINHGTTPTVGESSQAQAAQEPEGTGSSQRLSRRKGKGVLRVYNSDPDA